MGDEEEVWLAISAFGKKESARFVGETLVVEGLAACVNLLPKARSIYRWNGKIEHASEVVALFKTTRRRYPEFESRLRELHPYETPEVLALPASAALAEYARWVAAAVGGSPLEEPQGAPGRRQASGL
jgi:periplasmic divalent cation tolerance protein